MKTIRTNEKMETIEKAIDDLEILPGIWATGKAKRDRFVWDEEQEDQFGVVHHLSCEEEYGPVEYDELEFLNDNGYELADVPQEAYEKLCSLLEKEMVA